MQNLCGASNNAEFYMTWQSQKSLMARPLVAFTSNQIKQVRVYAGIFLYLDYKQQA